MNTSLNMSKLFDFFDKSEEICNKSKFNFTQIFHKYAHCTTANTCFVCTFEKQPELKYPQQKEELDKTNQLIELLSKILSLVVKIAIPGVILPKAVLSFYKYCTTDARNDAFELPILS